MNTPSPSATPSAIPSATTAATSAGTTRLDRHGSATVTLPSDTEILIIRLFDAPVERLFEAWTTPALVRRWWGFATSTFLVCDIDLRVGGDWRYVVREADGTEYGWHGTYREIVAPGLLVSTEVFEGYPDGEAVNTMLLTESNGVTTMRVTVLHSCKENRDGHINSGMETGMQITMNRLEDLVGTPVTATATANGSGR